MKRNLLPGSRGTGKGKPRRRRREPPAYQEPEPLQARTPALDRLREKVKEIRLDDQFAHARVRCCHLCGEDKRDVFRTKRDQDGKVIVRKIRGCGCAKPSQTVEITQDMALLARSVAFECGRLTENKDAQIFAMAQRLVQYLTFSL